MLAVKQREYIPIYQPDVGELEKCYVTQAMNSGWISSKGAFIQRFESNFAKFIDTPYATSVCNGTVALHLALAALNIGPGDEVIVPTLTYVASVNPILQVGATPVFVDSLSDCWQLDPADVEAKITSRTKAIMVVHLYGHPCDMEAIQQLAQKHQCYIIEDAAEAFGSTYKQQHVGSFGDISTFSFYGNKTITTGEGGMITCRDQALFQRLNKLKNQAVDQTKPYWHDEIGYNYRMTNLAAAIGCAQLEKANEILARKVAIAKRYFAHFANTKLITQTNVGDIENNYWLVSILVPNSVNRGPLQQYLQQHGIETRPIFYPIHTMPMYHQTQTSACFPVASTISARGINLPSWPNLTGDQIDYIATTIKEFMNNHA